MVKTNFCHYADKMIYCCCWMWEDRGG